MSARDRDVALGGGSHGIRHVAVIMDGNGRWAQHRGLPRSAGHRAGVKTARVVVETCAQLDIPVLTLFAFSSENWRRPPSEVRLLMGLFIEALQREVRDLHRNNVQLEFIGETSHLSDKLRAQIERSEELTAGNTGLKLRIAVSYGGRWDIANAARQLAERVRAGDLAPEDIDEAVVEHSLSTAGLPDPDLFIRTGGERRISNFLLWNLAYSEMYFTDTLWPDFDARALRDAVDYFSSRQRRFGRTGQQIT